MKELKFRAWDKDQKFYRYLTIDDAMMSELGPEGCLEFRGESTGLQDENGVITYEGDIARSRIRTGVVTYEEETACWYLEDSVGHSEPLYLEEIEVIGNIYENPELVNGK